MDTKEIMRIERVLETLKAERAALIANNRPVLAAQVTGKIRRIEARAEKRLAKG